MSKLIEKSSHDQNRIREEKVDSKFKSWLDLLYVTLLVQR